MFTVNTILKEISGLSPDRLEEVYEFVHALNVKKKKTSSRKKIMSFAGSFSDMSKADFKDFKKYNSEIRTSVFDRKIKL
jgi:hypothetical protein